MENLRLSAKIGLKWVFIPFLIILVMSHNAGAIDVMNDVNLIRGNMVYSFHCNDCSNQTMTIGSSGFNMISNGNQDLIAYVRSINIVLPSESYNNGDYLTLNMYVFNSLNNNGNDAVVKSFKTATNGWDLVDAEFSQISASSGMVNLTFRNYVAGTMTFNVCQYKDKAGNLISVFTSLTLIVFYLPLAIKLLSMIYNEIRSFTNG